MRGTAQIFTARRPALALLQLSHRHASPSTARSSTAPSRPRCSTLTNDPEGASEVGGLFLHPGERAGGLGMLLARSRYLFIARHRARFARRVLAELRGVIDEAGGSPFWDGVAARFFGMSFQAGRRVQRHRTATSSSPI